MRRPLADIVLRLAVLVALGVSSVLLWDYFRPDYAIGDAYGVPHEKRLVTWYPTCFNLWRDKCRLSVKDIKDDSVFHQSFQELLGIKSTWWDV